MGELRDRRALRPRLRFAPSRRTRDIVARVLRGALYLLCAAAFLLFAATGVDQITGDEGMISGIFVEERCEPSRYGCSSVGTWASHVGSPRFEEVRLDGRVGAAGRVEAFYLPNSIFTSEEHPVVHSGGALELRPLVSWGGMVLSAAAIVGTRLRWFGDWP